MAKIADGRKIRDTPPGFCVKERILSEEAYNTGGYERDVETLEKWRNHRGNKKNKTMEKEDKARKEGNGNHDQTRTDETRNRS